MTNRQTAQKLADREARIAALDAEILAVVLRRYHAGFPLAADSDISSFARLYDLGVPQLRACLNRLVKAGRLHLVVGHYFPADS